MDSFEWNKIFGAILGTGLLVFALKIVAGSLFHGELPEKPGFAIAAAEAPAAGAAAAAPAPLAPIAPLLAKADKTKGEAGAKACAACHDFTKGGPNKIGPNLYNVVGREIGTEPGFTYSAGFATEKGKHWDYDALNEWLHKPSDMIHGTKMGFSGIPNDQARADVIAYLSTLSDSPVPFPAP